MSVAPPSSPSGGPSSAGWKMKTTVPGRRSFIFARTSRRAEHDRGVRVVAAGVLHPRVAALVGDVVALLDGQRVHVRAQRHHRARPPAAQDPDHARLRHRVADLEAERLQPLRHQASGAHLAVSQLGVLVDVASRGDQRGAPSLPRRRGSRRRGRRRSGAGELKATMATSTKPSGPPSVGMAGGDATPGSASRAARSAGPRRAPFAGGEIAQGERADRHPHQLDDVVSDGRAHAAHLAVLALGEDDLQPAAVRAPDPSGAHLRRPGVAIRRRGHALAQRAQSLHVRHAAHARVVRLRHVVTGIGEPMAQAVVVGEDEEAGGVAVEAPDREHPLADVAEEVVHSRPPAGIGPGRDVADRLVERDGDAFGVVAHPRAVHGHPRPRRIDAPRGNEHHLAAHRHPPVRDPAARLAARADAELGERAGQGQAACQRPVGGRGGPSGRAPRRSHARPGGSSPSANVIWPSHTTWPSTRATPRRLPILPAQPHDRALEHHAVPGGHRPAIAHAVDAHEVDEAGAVLRLGQDQHRPRLGHGLGEDGGGQHRLPPGPAMK